MLTKLENLLQVCMLVSEYVSCHVSPSVFIVFVEPVCLLGLLSFFFLVSRMHKCVRMEVRLPFLTSLTISDFFLIYFEDKAPVKHMRQSAVLGLGSSC